LSFRGASKASEPGIHKPSIRDGILGTLYLGVTKDIVRRGYEHRTKAIDGFTTRCGVDKVVWFEI